MYFTLVLLLAVIEGTEGKQRGWEKAQRRGIPGTHQRLLPHPPPSI